jgi:hypothetical protein
LTPSSANGVALPEEETGSPRLALNGSVITPMNCVMASNVVCCVPVAVSPEACVSPAALRPPYTSGMPPLLLKKLISALPTLDWLRLKPLVGLPLRPLVGAATKSSARLR